MRRLTRDGTAEPVSRDQILRHARGRGHINFPCSADHGQDWQPYPVDPYSAIYDYHAYIHTYIVLRFLSVVAFFYVVTKKSWILRAAYLRILSIKVLHSIQSKDYVCFYNTQHPARAVVNIRVFFSIHLQPMSLHVITILPVVTKDLPVSPRCTPQEFLSRCKFSTLLQFVKQWLTVFRIRFFSHFFHLIYNSNL